MTSTRIPGLPFDVRVIDGPVDCGPADPPPDKGRPNDPAAFYGCGVLIVSVGLFALCLAAAWRLIAW